jgi:hypothetical protein
MKRFLLLLGVLVFLMSGCDNPTASGSGSGPVYDADGPADGTPWVFENRSSYAITVSPQDNHLDQGWRSFVLQIGQSKTIRVNKTYTAIYIKYNYASSVKVERVSGENKWIFSNRMITE